MQLRIENLAPERNFDFFFFIPFNTGANFSNMEAIFLRANFNVFRMDGNLQASVTNTFFSLN